MTKKRRMMSGNRAVAEAVKLSEVNVVSAYPITPQTSIIEYLSEYCANGDLNAEFVQVESEFAVMSACIGASTVGARTFTASCSQGLALMHELNYVAAGLRLPIVMAVTNRQLSQPVGIWCDYNDAMGERDSGWMQIYVENAQEALDTVIQAFKIAENSDVLLPMMVCLDGFLLSHTSEVVEVPDPKHVREFLPPYRPDAEYHAVLDINKPMVIGGGVPPAYTTEFVYKKYQAQENAKEVIKKVGEEFKKTFGREYGLVEAYRCDNAEIVLVVMGTMVGTSKEVVDQLRDEKGWAVGVLKLRCYRPFPTEEIKQIAASAKVVVVVNRAISYGIGAPVYSDVTATLYDIPEKPIVLNFIAGLGGRDITKKDITMIFDNAKNVMETGKKPGKMEWVKLNQSLIGV